MKDVVGILLLLNGGVALLRGKDTASAIFLVGSCILMYF
jgi:hypothetical protein